MRTYATDSPQAAARIIAVTLMSDGHVSKTELDLLEQIGVYGTLGIDKVQMLAVIQEFCNDLLQGGHPHWAGTCQIEPDTLAQLMAEVADPALRLQVLRLCVAVAEGDGHVADGESAVLISAVEQWSLHHQMLQPAERPVPSLPP